MSENKVEQVTEQLAKTYLDEPTGEYVSKSELKKRQKLRALEIKKAEKAKKAAATAPKVSKQSDELANVNPAQYFEIRSAQIQNLRKEDSETNPYPHKFHVTTEFPEFIKEYGHLQKGETKPDVKVSVSGRIMVKREAGQKLKFYNLQNNGVNLQIMAQAQDAEGDFAEMHKLLRRGDIIGVEGYPGRTNPSKGGEGELSVFSLAGNHQRK